MAFMAFIRFMLFLLWTIQVAATPVKRANPMVPNPAPMTGDYKGHVHDPSVIRHQNGTYFLFTTNDGINVYTAPSMSGPWAHQGSVFPDNDSKIIGPQGSGRTDLWCPDVFYNGQLYYLYYAASSLGSQNSTIGVATSPSMNLDEWTDHGDLGIPTAPQWNLIDPNVFRANEQTPYYLTFGSFYDQIFQVELGDPPINTLGDGSPVNLEHDSAIATNEGSFQFWLPLDGKVYYYLFFSSGNCCNDAAHKAAPGKEYKMKVCRSEQLRSGYVDQLNHPCIGENTGTVILASHDDVYAPGGGGVFYDSDQDVFLLYYHYVKLSVGMDYDQFFFGWNKLNFTSGWPVVY